MHNVVGRAQARRNEVTICKKRYVFGGRIRQLAEHRFLQWRA
jgi:hypothetical protein